MIKAKGLGMLSEKQKRFCQIYAKTLNGKQSYKKAYGVEKDDVATSNASRLLTNANVLLYIDYLNKNIEEAAEISRLKVINEHAKIAFSSIASINNTWITRKEFDELTEDEKACIQEISTKVANIMSNGIKIGETEYVRIKLYDKQKSLELISKMLGYDSPMQVQLTTIAPVIRFSDES